jgi:hypothetical protein
VNDTSIISIFADGYEQLIEPITASKMNAREVFYLTPKSEAASAANAILVSNHAPGSPQAYHHRGNNIGTAFSEKAAPFL